MGTKSRDIQHVDCEQIAPGWVDDAFSDMLTHDAEARGVTLKDDALALPVSKRTGDLKVVAVGIEDPTIDRLQVGIWSVTDLLTAETIIAVNEVARDYTMYPQPNRSADRMMRDYPAAQVILAAYETRYGLR